MYIRRHGELILALWKKMARSRVILVPTWAFLGGLCLWGDEIGERHIGDGGVVVKGGMVVGYPSNMQEKGYRSRFLVIMCI